MAGNIRSDFTQAISDLADGFGALEEEFKTLAAQHVSLKKQLSSMTDQALEHLVPDEKKPPMLLTSSKDDLCTDMATRRSVLEWVGDFHGSTDPSAQKSIAQIRDAEFACFKIREKLKQRGAAVDAGKKVVSTMKGERRVSFNDIEQDHTVSRSIGGELGCPFARIGQRKMGPPPPYVHSHDLSTPRSSGSQVDIVKTRSRSQRQSFNDPIKPEMEAPPSEASDAGAACPIRFLDRHSPEDVAKYFEEHKHELPRSHEFCVKRFQTNSESIKELDAKYGNLVNMIQGLGEKHQPMLPGAPKSAEIAAANEDTKSTQRVQKWAKAVSEGHPGDTPSPIEAVYENDARSEGADDERLPRFDRPLKEIRVGESPSRPWGVPIPSKYLDRAVKADVVDEFGPARLAKDSHAEAVEEQTREAPTRPKGKCPFGHGTAAAGTAPEPTMQPPLEHLDQIPALQKASAAAKPPQSTKPPQGPAELGNIVNFGVTIMFSALQLGKVKFENRGTLLIGYTGDEAQSLLRTFQG